MCRQADGVCGLVPFSPRHNPGCLFFRGLEAVQAANTGSGLPAQYLAECFPQRVMHASPDACVAKRLEVAIDAFSWAGFRGQQSPSTAGAGNGHYGVDNATHIGVSGTSSLFAGGITGSMSVHCPSGRLVSYGMAGSFPENAGNAMRVPIQLS